MKPEVLAATARQAARHGGTLYAPSNVVVAVVLRFPKCDVGKLYASLEDLIRRHPVLRTTLGLEGSRVRQHVANDPVLIVDVMSGTGAISEINDLFEAAADIDVRGGILLKVAICHSKAHVLVVLGVHHAACDAWSAQILARDLAELYLAKCDGRSPTLPDLELDFGDYVWWEEDELGMPDDFWRGYCGGDFARLPLGRGESASSTFDTHPLQRISSGIADELAAIAKHIGSTPARVLGAAVVASLAGAVTDISRPILIGVMNANRDQANMRNVVGDIADLLPVRCYLSGHPSFEDFAARFGAEVSTVFSHPTAWAGIARHLRTRDDRATGPILDLEFNYVTRIDGVSGFPDDPRVQMSDQVMAFGGNQLSPWGDWKAPVEVQWFPEDGGTIAGKLVVNADMVPKALANELGGRIHMGLERVAGIPGISVADVARARF